MDPQTTLRDALDELADLSLDTLRGRPTQAFRDAAITALRDLADWLEKGGYAPSVGRVNDDVFEILRKG